MTSPLRSNTLLIVLLALAAGCPCSRLAWAAQGPDAADMIATLLPAVVNITIVKHTMTGPVDGNMVGQPAVSDHTDQSSGFFVGATGLIVTNRHAVEGASEITVTLHDHTRLKACLVAAVSQIDLALLKVDAGEAMTTVAFGDSDAMRPGDPIFMIGNPLGLGSTVTGGIVSALDRNTEQSGFGAFFQIDAPLNHGNSGGPVFDAGGRVVGIATALVSPASETGSVGLGFAIRSLDAKLVVEQLLHDGQLRLGWIGAQIQPVTGDIAAAVRLPTATGSIVTAVADDSPATRAGLAAGDIILKFADDTGTAPRTLNRRIAGSAAGTVVELVVWRNAAQQDVRLIVGRSPSEPADAKPAAGGASCTTAPAEAQPDLGLLLAPVTQAVRANLGLSQGAGVLVADVAAGSIAADRGITAGSVILNVHQRPVATADDVPAGIEAARRDNSGFVLMLVRNEHGLRWVALPLAASGPP